MNQVNSVKVPLVSILCLTYNHANYIRDALDGFLSQKVNFLFEVIVHDDASTDETQEIVLDYQRRFPEIIKTIFQIENQRSRGGNVFGNAYNISKGKYIAYCEGDDYWVDEGKLAIQVDFLEKNPEYVITYSDCDPLFEDGTKPVKIWAANHDLSPADLKSAPPIHSLSACFRRVIEIPPEQGFVEYGDLFLWAMLGGYGSGKYLKNLRPSRYRVHLNGVHSTKTRQQRFEMIVLTFALMARYFRRIGDTNSANSYHLKIITETIKYIIKGVPCMQESVTAWKSLFR